MNEQDKTAGQLEAFEFMAKQLRTYADDNDELHRRYGTKGPKALAIAAKRSETFRDIAIDCDGYAAQCKKFLEGSK